MTEPIHPDLVNAIVRNPDDPRYPSQITVFCDHCGTEHTADYMVSEDMTSIERLAVARQHLVANKGWEHTEDGDDFCPEHAGSPVEEPAAVPLTVEQLAAIEARATAATPGPWCTDSWEIYQGTEYIAGAEWIGETCRGTTSLEQDRADAAFVAAARTDVPALLAEVARLKSLAGEQPAAEGAQR